MGENNIFRKGLIAICLAIVLLLGGCNLPWGSTTGPQAALYRGDFGDAPDGSQGMDTGYYGFAGGPFVFSLQSMGVQSQFPTIGNASVTGPYTLDVNEFYIGPLFGGDFSTNAPSVEEDATDPADPDGFPNIVAPTTPDCDKENGSHDPAGNGCVNTPAYSMPMNGRLLIFFAYPPLGVFTTSITASPNLKASGPAYWNFLIDLNQDGKWGPGEWVAQDVAVTLTAGQSTFVSSGAFPFPTSGTPWGRLKFPLWARSMVTAEKVKDYFPNNWDGRGMSG
jgi:hypothetical protein